MKTSYSSGDESPSPGEDSGHWTSGHHSDFSIDYILSKDGPGSRRTQQPRSPETAPLDGFAWLQCTRYRPPKLQRSRRKEGRQRRQPGRNPRIPFSGEQVALLEQRFRASQYLGGSEVARLSSILCLSETRVKIWFQNRRARERRERQANSTGISTNSPTDEKEATTNSCIGESPIKSNIKILPTSQTSAFMPYAFKMASNSSIMDNNYDSIKNYALYQEVALELQHLLLCNLEQADLNLSEISHHFPYLVTLEVHNSNITTIDHNGAAGSSFPNLQIMLPHLHALDKLDLSYNRLTDLSAYDLVNVPNLRSISLAGNPWECERSMLWLLEPQKYFLPIQHFISNERMTCGGKKYNGKQVMGVLNMKKVLEDTCPEVCTCSIDKVVGNLIPLITVDCSHRGLTEMPKTLPINTTTLRLQNNKLTDVMPLVNNTDYSIVKDVYLDYNRIASLDVLEGSKWLESFRLLSLRGNYLTQLHIYSFNHAFEPNQHFDNIFLGKNPWKCDCSFTPAFRDLILKYESYVKDINDIRCAETDNDENSNLLIVDLQTRTLCVEKGFLTKLSFLDYCSLLFATLTVLVISNFIFDWIRYRKSGKLPWIAKYLP
ncbi:hypothetical protein LSTR_LSTR007413 [Laodelphax striatellus]|uniref:Homeobox domain-containing protein n=1 Tax=Laodelphax striatellus TaxID=195883 RepID=A0A482XP35_LAOST|nr:hypothetical protein LSTR_LSTR007413 [Laodelphax striatellus]